MDRSERIGLGVALLAHVILFGLLSTVWLARPRPAMRLAEPMEVQFSDKVAMQSSSPSREEAAPSVAPEVAKPQEAPPPLPPTPAPTPAPQPKPIPAPQPKPAPTKPAPKPEPAPNPAPTPRKEASVKPTPAAKPTPEKSPPKHERLSPDFLKDLPTAGEGKSAAAKPAKATGSLLGKDFLKGLSDKPSPSKASAPKAATLAPAVVAGLNAAIFRQIHPCYDLGSLSGTPAMSIVTVLHIRYDRDGTVDGSPQVVGQTGVTADNRSYREQMADISRRAVLRCSPVHLPPEMYDNGWHEIELSFIPGKM